MKENSDIETRADIESMIHTFYERAMMDTVIGYIFTDIAKLNLDEHVPRIVDFWDSVLFGTAKYQGNPVLKHVHLHQLSPLKREHFNRWLEIWNQTIAELFEGEKAKEAISKAKMMAELMMYKIDASEKKGFVL